MALKPNREPSFEDWLEDEHASLEGNAIKLSICVPGNSLRGTP